MKSIFKLALTLIISFFAGLVIVNLIFWIIDGESPTKLLQRIAGDNIGLFIVETLLLLFSILAAVILQIIIHEGGHLVAGLMSGYRFVSFRFLNYTIISKDGHLQLRNFELGGTGGQCLLAPPDKPKEQIDTRWYNAGGVLANIISAAIAIVLLCTVSMPEWLEAFMLTTVFTGIGFAILNGVPMKIAGGGNDGLNLLNLEKNPASKQCFLNILEVNALVHEGQQYKDMPERLFATPDPLDWENALHVGCRMMNVNRMMNVYQWEDAYDLMTEVMANKDVMTTISQAESKCVMTLVCIATGRYDEAREYYDKKTAKYARQFASTQSDKQAVVMAATLALDGDRDKAEQMLQHLESTRDKYVLQGETDMNIDTMHWLLDNR